MAREFSAGGVVVRHRQGQWWLAAIEPRREAQGVGKTDRPRHKLTPVLALPKGLVDQGEKPDQTAVREVREETGVEASIIAKLSDIKYFYVRSWSDKQRVFKIVSFYLLLYSSGRIGEISEDMRVEVERGLWVPLDQAAEQLTYKGEREVVKKAQEYLRAHPEMQPRSPEPKITESA